MRASLLLSLFVSLTGDVASFQLRQNTPHAVQGLIRRKAVAVEPPATEAVLPDLCSSLLEEEEEEFTDLSGVAMSGLQGKAFKMRNYPTVSELRAVIPKDCFQPDTLTSMGYLAVSLSLTALCTLVGVNGLLPVLNPSNPLSWPVWAAYDVVTGSIAMGLWVLAHECGHGAFSTNKKLQDAVGYTLHSLLLVPYYSWQRSHAVHHQYTNHMELGETHVPERIEDKDSGSFGLRSFLLKSLGVEQGLNAWGSLMLFSHLVIGWPAYLLVGATGGPSRGMTNHYLPDPLTESPQKELFPGKWKDKVVQSDYGIAAVCLGLVVWASQQGLAPVFALYGGPLLVVNAWLVTITWLQHTDVDVPHFSDEDHSFVKGALHTIDRPYEELLGGTIDFLHHRIGSTHVAHHFDSTMPHYKAQKATDAIKEAFPDFYLRDPTPVPQALWRVAKSCVAVEKRGQRWVWNNEGVEKHL